MIRVTHRIDTAAAAMDALARTLLPTMEEAIETALGNVISQLIPVTPVLSGDMARGYQAYQSGPLEWQLENVAMRAGFSYPQRVAGEPGFSMAYPALARVLEQAEADIGYDLDVAITRVVRRITHE